MGIRELGTAGVRGAVKQASSIRCPVHPDYNGVALEHSVQCRTPTLVVASAADKLLPSLAEAARLVRTMPDARRLVLPESGHTALLESANCLASLLRRSGFLPPALRTARPPRAAEAGALATEPCDSQVVPCSLPCLSGSIVKVSKPA